MRRPRIRRWLRAGIAAVAIANLCLVEPAAAGVGEDMTGFFSDMGAAANATGPVAFEGQSAGYYSLGSVWTRFPQKTVYPANLQMPKVTAGCGGIDIFTGSFSFVNASELVAMMKAIANNAIGFAFKLAIDAISPQIGGVMDKMQEIADKINQFNINSCEASKGLVGGVLGTIGVQSDRVCQEIGNSQGIFSDWAKSRQGCGNGGQQTSTIAANADQSLAAQMAGPKNYAWDLINGSPLSTESQTMRELVMTMTGTIIVPRRTNDNDQPNIQYVGGQVGTVLDALLDGDKSVTLLGCADADKCMTTGAKTMAALGDAALCPRVRNLIVSMSDKAVSDTALTSEEKALLGVASIPLYKIIAVQAASGFRLSSSEIDSLAELTAIDMLSAIVTNMLEQVSAARGSLMNAGDAKNVDQFVTQLRDVRERIAARDSKVTDRVNRTIEIVNRAMTIEASLQGRMSPGMAASLNFSRALSSQGLR